jgi:hypothetical protein
MSETSEILLVIIGIMLASAYVGVGKLVPVWVRFVISLPAIGYILYMGLTDDRLVVILFMLARLPGLVPKLETGCRVPAQALDGLASMATAAAFAGTARVSGL